MLAQRLHVRLTPHFALLPMALVVLGAYIGGALWTLRTSVSYTHLTLPTTPYV